MPVEYFVLSNVRFEGPIVGHFAGSPVRETVVDGSGTQYRFAGIAPRDCDGRFNVNLLKPGEWIVEPGLIYAANRSPRR